MDDISVVFAFRRDMRHRDIVMTELWPSRVTACHSLSAAANSAASTSCRVKSSTPTQPAGACVRAAVGEWPARTNPAKERRAAACRMVWGVVTHKHVACLVTPQNNVFSKPFFHCNQMIGRHSLKCGIHHDGGACKPPCLQNTLFPNNVFQVITH